VTGVTRSYSSGDIRSTSPQEKDSDRDPKVSVIIPVYRGAQYIAQAVRSVLEQTFRKFEIIVVNDGSPETAEVDRELRPYLERIVYLSQHNAGPSAARNTGIRRARGEYIAFLDCDDSWYPEYLAEQVGALMADPGLDLIYCDALLVGDSRRAGRRAMEFNPSEGKVTLESLLKMDCRLITSCTVVRRQSLVDAGMFDENLRCCEDFDLWVRLADRGSRMAYHYKVLGKRRIHGESVTADNTFFFQSQAGVFAKIVQNLPLIPRHQEIVRKQIERCQANMQLHRSKAELIAGRYSDAVAALKSANAYFQSSRLQAVQWGIQLMPSALRVAYCARDRWYKRLGRKNVAATLSPETLRRRQI
jgi:glycosyltransferase involved in cell wall biosynthesis